MREARFWPKMKFETIFFQVLWQFFNPKGSLPQAGGGGTWGEFRPPYKFWAKSVRIFSNAHRQNSEFKFPPEIWSARSAVCSAFPPQNPDSARIRHAPRGSKSRFEL